MNVDRLFDQLLTDIAKKPIDVVKMSIESYIQAGGDFRDINKGRELLKKAVDYDKPKIIKMLLDSGANPGAIDDRPYVYWYVGHQKTSDFSLKVSNPKNEIPFETNKPLIPASKPPSKLSKSHKELEVELGRHLGATLNETSVFFYAACQDKRKLASLNALISDSTQSESEINLALCYAFRCRDIKQIQWLLQNGGNIRYVNKYAIYQFEKKFVKKDAEDAGEDFFIFKGSANHYEGLLHTAFDSSKKAELEEYRKFITELRALLNHDEFNFLIDFMNDEGRRPTLYLSSMWLTPKSNFDRDIDQRLLCEIGSIITEINLRSELEKAKSEIPKEPVPTISRKRSFDIL